MMDELIWTLLAINAGIAFVFAWGLKRSTDGDKWRAMVRDWVGSKALWIGVLTVYWALGWIGFTAIVPPLAPVVYALVLVSFTIFHARAAVIWLTGQSQPGSGAAA